MDSSETISSYCCESVTRSPLLLLLLMGCMSPFNTRLPTLANKPIETERREAQIKDPYPDSQFGPQTGFRPLGYQAQRSEPLRAKDRYFTSFFQMRQKQGIQVGPAAYMPGPMTHAYVPQPGMPQPGLSPPIVYGPPVPVAQYPIAPYQIAPY